MTSELYDLCPSKGVTAHAGTGFDTLNKQHRKGSDVVRYALQMQQARDAGDFERADEIRQRATFCTITQTETSTTITPHSKFVIRDGILYDREGKA